MAQSSVTASAHLLDSCPDRDVYLLFHKLLDVCCDTTHTADQQAAQVHLWSEPTFARQFVPAVWPTEATFRAACLHLLQLCYQIGCQIVDLEEHLQNQAFSEKVKLIWQECLQVRQKELFKSIIHKTVTSQLASLERYDWQVSVVMSSDRLSTIKVAILKLSFQVRPPSDPRGSEDDDQTEKRSQVDRAVLFSSASPLSEWNRAKVISFEFTKEELASFIQTLEEAKQALAQAVSA